MRVAIIDDDVTMSKTTQVWLKDAGYQVSVYSEPHQFMRSVGGIGPHLILLDWVMPGLNGPELLVQLREHLRINCPVIFVTSMDSAECIAEGLELGADDYIVKPIVKQVLLARVRAVMRRYDGPVAGKGTVMEEGPYKLDLKSRVLSITNRPIQLTPKEFDLAWLLFSRIEQFMPKQEALARVWGKDTEVDTHTLAQHIYALKKKLSLDEHNYRITAVYGTGYRLESIHT